MLLYIYMKQITRKYQTFYRKCEIIIYNKVFFDIKYG